MSSTSLQNSGAAPGTENENPETTVNDSNEVIQSQDSDNPPSVNEGNDNPSVAKSEDELSQASYLDAGEALPRSKSQDLSEDDVPIPSSQLSLIFEREVAPDLSAAQSYNSVTQIQPADNTNATFCQITIAPRPPSPASSTCLLSEEDCNNSYMRSITSLVGGGEGPISSLSDILVWTETAMGTAAGMLDASHTSVTDMLHGTGTALRSMTSLLGGARTVLTTGFLSGTGAMLRTMSQFLGNIERRTVEGIRFAFRFMAHHMSPHRNNTDCDNE
ncbi:testis-expressed protein 44 [Dromiciops gliroides]|uniref:testis-expressed protein 44 n=1 Tax=Dromiciops gliroides TaxID=33562 RepID=UPI001CC80FC0|nr:testis-expressed protein 44 [Dromiciops gliroides]